MALKVYLIEASDQIYATAEHSLEEAFGFFTRLLKSETVKIEDIDDVTPDTGDYLCFEFFDEEGMPEGVHNIFFEGEIVATFDNYTRKFSPENLVWEKDIGALFYVAFEMGRRSENIFKKEAVLDIIKKS